jgi:hypothetical protein
VPVTARCVRSCRVQAGKSVGALAAAQPITLCASTGKLWLIRSFGVGLRLVVDRVANPASVLGLPRRHGIAHAIVIWHTGRVRRHGGRPAAASNCHCAKNSAFYIMPGKADPAWPEQRKRCLFLTRK